MLLRQMFNHPTFSYTYLLADPVRAEAVLIDPVKTKLRDYVQLANELGLAITAAIDTHQHDDRASGIHSLRQLWNCDAIIGAPRAEPADSRQVVDGDVIQVGGMQLKVLHTPGHTADSYSFLIEQPGKSAVFTGDTLLVRTLGLSNQESSDPSQHYNSLINVLTQLPDDTIVYPGRDFKGWPLSTIGEEIAFNPYLQVETLEEFLELKERQKPADIQPLVKVEEEDEAEEIILTDVADFTAPASSDFYLPDDEADTVGGLDAPEPDAAQASKPESKPDSKSEPGLEPIEDTSSVPSWR